VRGGIGVGISQIPITTAKRKPKRRSDKPGNRRSGIPRERGLGTCAVSRLTGH
jgi:hypothetical protein